LARLVYKGNGGKERSFELGGSTKVGGHPVCQLQLLDERVSKQHFEINAFENSYWIRDLGSINGTLVNGVRISADRRLDHLDEIRILDIRLLFLDADSALRRSPTGNPYRKAANVVTDALDAPRSQRSPRSDKGDLASLRRFYALVRMLSAESRSDQLARDAAHGLLSLCEADWAALWWGNPGSDFRELARAARDKEPAASKPPAGLFDIAVRSRAPTFQLGQDGLLHLVVPLLHAGQARGVLWVGLDGSVATPAAVELLSSYAAFVAVALDALPG